MRDHPDFSGWRAVILHSAGATTERLSLQMELLGFRVEIQWSPLDAADLPDLVVVDADRGWDGLLPWTVGHAPVPVVAVLASEAPGRVAWAMEQGAGAIIAKPVAASAVYPALVMASGVHAERREMRERLARLDERARMRPLVYAAVGKIMAARELDEEGAYGVLRREAMRKRLAVEQVAASVLGGLDALSEVG